MVVDFLNPINFVFYIPLFFLSLVTMTIIIEKVHDLLKNPLLNQTSYQAIYSSLRKRDLQPVGETIKKGEHLEIQYLREFIQLRKSFHPNLINQLDILAREMILNREVRLDLLTSISSVATMLGLLGTVTGMIWSFQAMSAAGRPDPAVLSGGIAQALITTALGLLIAIPSLSAANIFKLRVKKLSTRLEFIYEELLAIQSARHG
jgi:biopolymer transport protein ExbB